MCDGTHDPLVQLVEAFLQALGVGVQRSKSCAGVLVGVARCVCGARRCELLRGEVRLLGDVLEVWGSN